MKPIERALIEPGFLDTYTEFIRHSLEKAEKELSMFKNARLIETETFRIGKLRGILNGTPGTRGSLDHEMTRLRRLPVVRYYSEIVQPENGFEERTFLCADTKPVLMFEVNRSLKKPKWNGGPYKIAIPLLNPSAFHLIPLDDPRTSSRHPHHTAGPVSGVDNPLNFNRGTCLKQFAFIINTLAADGEIAELFGVLYRFTASVNTGSTLRTAKYITHLKEI